MMMKAEIAREMMRSRTQTPIPAPRRTEVVVTGTQAASVGGVGAPASPAELGSVNVPGMRSLLYTEPVSVAAGCIARPQIAQCPPSITSTALSPRVTITQREETNDTPYIPEQDCLPQPDRSLPLPGNHFERIGRMGRAAGGRRHPGVQCRTSAQRDETASHSDQGRPLGRRRAGSLPDARLRTGGEDSQRDPPAALLLLLRSHGPQQPAQLL